MVCKITQNPGVTFTNLNEIVCLVSPDLHEI